MPRTARCYLIEYDGGKYEWNRWNCYLVNKGKRVLDTIFVTFDKGTGWDGQNKLGIYVMGLSKQEALDKGAMIILNHIEGTKPNNHSGLLGKMYDLLFKNK